MIRKRKKIEYEPVEMRYVSLEDSTSLMAASVVTIKKTNDGVKVEPFEPVQSSIDEKYYFDVEFE